VIHRDRSIDEVIDGEQKGDAIPSFHFMAQRSFFAHSSAFDRGQKTNATNDVQRRASARKGARRKIVPLKRAEDDAALANDDDDDEPLEYAKEYANEWTSKEAKARIRVGASERARRDVAHVPFVAPRVAIGVASELMNRPNEAFADALAFARSLTTSDDVVRDIAKKTEKEIDRLESIGVRATTPVRNAIKDMIPREVYDEYLTPALEYAEIELEEETRRARDGAANEAIVMEDVGSFDEAAVSAAADAVAAAMRGAEVEVGAETATSETETPNASKAKRAPDNAEDNFENIAAEAIMSSSAVSATYAAPAEDPYSATPPTAAKPKKTPAKRKTAKNVALESVDESMQTLASTAALDATVGYWRKISDRCPDEDELMDVMEMNLVFRQAAGLLNYLTIDRPTPTSWRVATNAGIIQISEVYQADGSQSTVARRDLRSGDQTGAVVADADAVSLAISWSSPLSGSQRETFSIDRETDTLLRVVRLELESGKSWSGTYVYARA